MKRKLLVFALISCVSGGAAYGQQDKLLTHFMYDKMSLNPGETGIDQGICATLAYRNQWDKVNGAPNSAIFNLEGNLNQYRIPGGLGVSFYHDAIGFSRQNTVTLNYSYHIEMPGVGILGLGAGLGITNFGMNPTWVPPSSIGDPKLPVGFAETKFDANFGIYMKGQSGWYAGLSSTHLPGSEFDDVSGLNNYSSVRHYYAMGGYRMDGVGAPNNDLEFNMLLRTDLVKASVDIGARYYWEDKLYGGLVYRTSDAIGVMLGANLDNFIAVPNLLDSNTNGTFVIGYSYDVTINRLASVSRGSHEILMKYCAFLPPIPIEKTKHVRWL